MRRSAHALLVYATALALGPSCDRGGHAAQRPPRAFPSADARLAFVDSNHGGEQVLTKRELSEGALEIVSGFDPYYQRDKRYWALPLAPILARGLPGVALETAQLVLRAEDGYTVPVEGARLLDGTAYLALADADHPAAWDPIGPQRADPGGFYLVWKGADRADLVRFPRPWGLVRVERTTFEAAYPHTAPTGIPLGTPAQLGYHLFIGECIRCHAINREGGRVGPELNVPRSIVEYRPIEQIKAYIHDPQAFRYSAMPAHPQLREQDLDALIAYFQAMSARKYDPEARR
jgi:mono/diheme cytochrome c family protein